MIVILNFECNTALYMGCKVYNEHFFIIDRIEQNSIS